MQRNRRKQQTLEIFSRRPILTPGEYAVEAGFYPARAAWSYLRRLYLMRYLNRSRDRRGRLQYRLSPAGARRLLALHRGEFAW